MHPTLFIGLIQFVKKDPPFKQTKRFLFKSYYTKMNTVYLNSTQTIHYQMKYWSSSLFKTLRYLIVIKNEGQPKRTFYIAFGHDEEVGGHKGAKEIAKKLEEVLEQENEKLSFVLDEGMMVLDGVFPGISEPVAYVGKGKFEYYSFLMTT